MYELKIEAPDKAGVIEYLAAVQAEHYAAGKAAGSKDEKARQAGIAEGIEKAITALRAWVQPAPGPDLRRFAPPGPSADRGLPDGEPLRTGL